MEYNLSHIIIGTLIIIINIISLLSKKPRFILLTGIISVFLITLLLLIK